MEALDPKKLAALVKACRKAGIIEFKGYGVEFTIGAEPQPKVSKRQSKQAVQTSDKIETDSLTDEELLFYSVRSDTDEVLT